jgi:Cu/Ag efflux pump CusA
MFRWLIGSSLQFRFLLIAAALALMGYGAVHLRQAAVDVLPEFSATYVEVQTEALGLSAAEVEALITVPVEEVLNGVPWLKTMRSESVTGLSSIVMVFEPGTNLLRARQMVQERLTQAQGLPSRKVAKAPVMLQPRSSASRIMMVGLSSSTLSRIDLSVLTRWTIKPRLMGVPGVANVSVWGQRERQLQVQVDPARLHAAKVTLDQIISTTGNALWVSPLSYLQASTPGSGGFIDTSNQRLGIRHVLPIATPADLAKVVVDGTRLPLGQLTSVVENNQPLIGDAIVNGAPGLLLVVEKFPGADALDVTRRVEAALSALRPGLSGVMIDTGVFRPANYLTAALGNLRQAALLGGLLAALVLVAFLHDWRRGVISLVALGTSLMTALLVLQQRGTTFNLLVLAGLLLALGAVIDDAVLGTEQHALWRRGSSADQAHSRLAAILASTLAARHSLMYASLISALAALPLLLLPGIWGAFAQPLVGPYLLALLVSMLVALTVTPALTLLLFRQAPVGAGEVNAASPEPGTASAASVTPRPTTRQPTTPPPHTPLAAWLERGYERRGAGLLGRSGLAMTVVAGLMLLGTALLPRLGPVSLLPSLQERDLLVPWTGAAGASHPAMLTLAQTVSAKLRALPGVQGVSAQLGRAVTSDEVTGIGAGKLWVRLNPGADRAQVVAAISAALRPYPAFNQGVQTYLKSKTDAALSGADNDLTVRVYGQDLAILAQKAREVQQLLSGVPGVVGAQVRQQAQEPSVEVQVDLAKAQRFGLKPGDVRRAAATLVNGVEVGNLFEAQKVFDVLVVGSPTVRVGLESVRNLMIDTPGGGQVRLTQVAAVRLAPIPTVIRRQGASRWVAVQGSVQGRDLNSVVRDVQASLQTVTFAREYHAELLGEYAELQATQRSLWSVALAAVLGIFLLLQAAFRSWRLALLAFLALPAALVGGVLAAYLSGGVLSLGSLVGFLTVLGIAARNGIMLINHYQHLEGEEGQTFGPELILRGARERLLPMLTTALALTAALGPLLLLGNVAGLELLRPMAVVILGGLVTSTLLGAFVLPALYLWLKDVPEPELDLGPVPGWVPVLGGPDAAD